MVTFKYNNRVYKAQHLKNKLKKLKITEEDIEILPNENEIELEKKIESLPYESWHNPKLYKFYNSKDKTTILSIYNNLDNLKGIINIEDYIKSV